MKKVLNATAHKLTEAQINELKRLYGDDVIVDDLKDVCGLYDELIDVDVEFMECVIDNFVDYIKSCDYDVIHLPISSPAVMFAVAYKLGRSDTIHLTKDIIFSHSIRKSIEKEINGQVIKQSIFEFKYFIHLKDIVDIPHEV